MHNRNVRYPQNGTLLPTKRTNQALYIHYTLYVLHSIGDDDDDDGHHLDATLSIGCSFRACNGERNLKLGSIDGIRWCSKIVDDLEADDLAMIWAIYPRVWIDGFNVKVHANQHLFRSALMCMIRCAVTIWFSWVFFGCLDLDLWINIVILSRFNFGSAVWFLHDLCNEMYRIIIVDG